MEIYMANELCAYSDESGFPSERYQSIGVISGFEQDILALEEDLNYILQEYGRTSLEFKKIDGSSDKTKCAIDMLNKVFQFIQENNIKIDILTWDTQDSRHKILRRNNLENFKRMYYKILVLCGERWGLAKVKVYPDEHSAIDWNNDLKPILNNTDLNKKQTILENIFEIPKQDIKNILRMTIEEKKSCENNIIQIIDILTGLVRYSFTNGRRILQWIKEKSQPSLFGNLVDSLSHGEESKFLVFENFYSLCKNTQDSISFEKYGYLRTFNKGEKINFRFYEPQSIHDKAPVKNN